MTTSISPIADQAPSSASLPAYGEADARLGAESVDARLAALLAGSETYSTAEVAKLFNRTDQWVYWVLRDGVTRADGTPIEPERVGRSQRRRFTKKVIVEIAVALNRRGTLGQDRLREVLVKLPR